MYLNQNFTNSFGVIKMNILRIISEKMFIQNNKITLILCNVVLTI